MFVRLTTCLLSQLNIPQPSWEWKFTCTCSSLRGRLSLAPQAARDEAEGSQAQEHEAGRFGDVADQGDRATVQAGERSIIPDAKTSHIDDAGVNQRLGLCEDRSVVGSEDVVEAGITDVG